MKIEFTVTGEDAVEIRAKAVQIADEFFGKAHVQFGAITAHRLTEGGWKANVEAWNTPPVPPKVAT